MPKRHTRRITHAQKILRRHPFLILPLVLLLAGLYAHEVFIARPAMSFQGLPIAHDLQPIHWTRILRNEAFLIGYSDLRGNPLWLSYRVGPVPENANFHKRPRRFTSDWRNITQIDHDHYTGSGYDRGHMAPNYAISRLYGRNAQLDTFKMTNIVPQKPKLNQKLWQRLEEVEIDEFTRHFDNIWVYTGPIFDQDIVRLTSSALVEVPDAFFKIYVAPGDSPATTHMLAFIMPQEVRGNEALDRYLVNVDKVEELTGFDFFHQLDDPLERRLESTIDAKPWQLDKVARKPARY